eukprot:GILI01001443.1.p2 GENE.GILI01001443.1~~GILI01001443.1.p2  ORF type:complete len:464 (+),score=173.84 GILI01001443.1:75-1394(+)
MLSFGRRVINNVRQATAFMTPSQQQIRRLNIHEYQSMAVLEKFGVTVPRGSVAKTPQEAEAAARSLGSNVDFVVKAQVLAGGRGLGKFVPSGFEGGVQMCNTPEEVSAVSEQMLGQTLVTKQTGAEGKPCNSVFVVERLFLRRETYFAILMDRAYNGPVMIGSPRGGVNIEDVAAKTPEKIFKEPVDIMAGVNMDQCRRLAKNMGFTGEKVEKAAEEMKRLYSTFIRKDCTLVEVNPFGETIDGRVVVCDAKLNFDDNAAYRQKDVFTLRDTSQEDSREVQAAQFDLNYIGLDGEIGCMVNGAGLAMATMDIIKLHGGAPANFLDVGGGATESQVVEAFKILNNDNKVQAILVNIFGGIMRCDVIALGIIKAASQLGLTKPLVVRLKGTNVEAAKKLIEESGLRMIFTEDLDDAAAKSVNITKILRMAKESRLDISFDM